MRAVIAKWRDTGDTLKRMEMADGAISTLETLVLQSLQLYIVIPPLETLLRDSDYDGDCDGDCDGDGDGDGDGGGDDGG